MARPQLPALEQRDAKLLRKWVRGTVKALRITQADVVELRRLGRLPQMLKWVDRNESMAKVLFGHNIDFRAERSIRWLQNAMLDDKERRLTARTAMELWFRLSECVLLNPHGVPQNDLPVLPFAVFRRMMRKWAEDMGPSEDVSVYIARDEIPSLANALARIATASKRSGESTWRYNRLMTRFATYLARKCARA